MSSPTRLRAQAEAAVTVVQNAALTQKLRATEATLAVAVADANLLKDANDATTETLAVRQANLCFVLHCLLTVRTDQLGWQLARNV